MYSDACKITALCMLFTVSLGWDDQYLLLSSGNIYKLQTEFLLS